MPQPLDLNLLYALKILLDEGSVQGAAKRLNLSTPAASRILTRIREQFDDPIMVRAGRNLVPTPYALALKSQLDEIMSRVAQLNRSALPFTPASMTRRFVLRANDIFTAALAGGLLEQLQRAAPHSRFTLVPESEEDDDALRTGRVDLSIGASRAWHNEIKAQRLFSSHFQLLVRQGHPLCEALTPQTLVNFPHISISRRGRAEGPIDSALQQLGLQRRIALTLPGFHSALFLLPGSDFVLPMPHHITDTLQQLPLPLAVLPMPFPLEPVNVVQAWHPRFDRDPEHRWLRETIKGHFQVGINADPTA